MDRDTKHYIINEFKSYRYLVKRLSDMSISYDATLKHINDELEMIDEQLNSFGYVCPNSHTDVISVTPLPNHNRVLELLSSQDRLLIRRKEIIDLQNNEIEYVVHRLDTMNILLSYLNNDDREFITEFYINHKSVRYMCDNMHYSKTGLFKRSDRIIRLMIRKSSEL